MLLRQPHSLSGHYSSRSISNRNFYDRDGFGDVHEARKNSPCACDAGASRGQTWKLMIDWISLENLKKMKQKREKRRTWHYAQRKLRLRREKANTKVSIKPENKITPVISLSLRSSGIPTPLNPAATIARTWEKRKEKTYPSQHTEKKECKERKMIEKIFQSHGVRVRQGVDHSI